MTSGEVVAMTVATSSSYAVSSAVGTTNSGVSTTGRISTCDASVGTSTGRASVAIAEVPETAPHSEDD